MKKYQNELSTGVFVLFGLLCIAYMTVKLGNLEIFEGDSYQITANFATVTGLRNGASIDLAGVSVGKVVKIELTPGPDYRARVTMRINKEIELSDDAIAAIKTNGLIGDKYIDISQGGSSTFLENSDELTETQAPMDLEALISKYVFGGVDKND